MTLADAEEHSRFNAAPDSSPTPDGAASPEQAVEVLRAAVVQLQRELVATQRLALLGSRAAMAAHEFNNLMTPILARVQDALGRDDPAAMRKALERTLVNAQKSIAVCQHMLGVARGGEEVVEVRGVAEAVADALASTVRPFEKEGIRLEVDVPDELRVETHARLLDQLVLNLLLNAQRAMKPGGGTLRVRARREAGDVLIEVADDGSGLSGDYLERVVNPFLSADATKNPCDWNEVGLGLNVCRTIVQQHGGSIEATANEGAGCTFRVRWPAA